MRYGCNRVTAPVYIGLVGHPSIAKQSHCCGCKLANIYFEPPTKILTVDFYKYMIWLILNR